MSEKTEAGKQHLGLFLDQRRTIQWKSMSHKGNVNFSRSHSTKGKESGETSNSLTWYLISVCTGH